MQITLDSFALKPFTKALTCLSKYGDELLIYANADSLSLSTTNSSKSAYCRFKYQNAFFSRYAIPHAQVPAIQSADTDNWSVTGQLLTRPLLSILRHKAVEKTVEKCELSIVEGSRNANDGDDADSLESQLIVRLHCKHGIIKTHRLLLQSLASLLAPGVPDASNESNLTIGPRALRDMIEHFPAAKGLKSDPQIIWTFGEAEVALRSLDYASDGKGRAQLSTELTISADEFDVYDIYAEPTTIAFHLREFNATIAFADSMSLSLDLRFTDPSAPLFIDIESDNTEVLFVISTSQVSGATSNVPVKIRAPDKKREREETEMQVEQIRPRKPMKVVQRVEAESRSQQSGAMGPPVSQPVEDYATLTEPPLFLPASQMSVAQAEAIRLSGLGIENMNAEELTAMLEGEGEEVALDLSQPNHQPSPPITRNRLVEARDSLELEIEEPEMSATQLDNMMPFQPLFED